MVQYEKAIEGLMAYVNENLIPGMNSLQEVGARIVLGELYDQRETLKSVIMNNGIIKTFGYVDNDGNLNIDRLFQRLKKEIEKKEVLEISVPLYGKFKFKPEDIEVIYRYINER